MSEIPEEDRKKLCLIVNEAKKFKGEEITVIDLRGRSPLSDYFIITTCESPRQMEALGAGIVFSLKTAGYKIDHREGSGEDRWFLLDYNDVLVNLFYPESRAFYNLDELYRSAPIINVSALESDKDV